jgi:hypothetical protein
LVVFDPGFEIMPGTGVADVKEDLNDYDYEHGPYEIRGE